MTINNLSIVCAWLMSLLGLFAYFPRLCLTEEVMYGQGEGEVFERPWPTRLHYVVGSTFLFFIIFRSFKPLETTKQKKALYTLNSNKVRILPSCLGLQQCLTCFDN